MEDKPHHVWRPKRMTHQRQGYNRAKYLWLMFSVVLMFSLRAAPALPWNPKSPYDNQVWPEVQTTTTLNRYIDVILNGQLRVGRDISALVRESVTAGFDLSAINWLTLSVRYMSIGEQPTPDRKTYENRVQFYPSIYFTHGLLKIDVTNKFEYRFRYPIQDSFRYRPSLTLEHPLGPERLHLNAYVTEEGFYSTQYGQFYRLRSYIGLRKKINEYMGLKLYYCRQQNIAGIRGNLNIIGIVMAFKFDVEKLRRNSGVI
jgi:hypothetical protein